MARKTTSTKVEVQEFVVGQLEDARKRLVVFERELVKRGKAQQREVEVLLKSVRQGKPLKAIEKQANAAGTEVKKRLDGLQDQVLGVLGVASRAEISQINRELTKLSKKVDALVTKKSGTATVA
jgi:uncharacterized protein YukE